MSYRERSMSIFLVGFGMDPSGFAFTSRACSWVMGMVLIAAAANCSIFFNRDELRVTRSTVSLAFVLLFSSFLEADADFLAFLWSPFSFSLLTASGHAALLAWHAMYVPVDW